MLNSFRQKVFHYLDNSQDYVVLIALASGLYPWLYYYNQNFISVNSWSQFLFFVVTYLLVPIIGFLVINYFLKRLFFLKFFHKYILTGLNFFSFTVLIITSAYGFRKKLIAIMLLVSFILMFILYKYIKKIVLLQLLMACLALLMTLPKLITYFNRQDDWLKQPDNIEQVIFKEKPNIYIIQPDGYANFLQLNDGDYDNNDFRGFLIDSDFKIYDDFRSNYYLTLTSNSSMFAMKHHYYVNPNGNKDNHYDFRKILAGENSSIGIFNNNNYKTFLLLEYPYLIINRPKMRYDYSNYNFYNTPFLSNNSATGRDVILELEKQIKNNSNTNNFYFIEKILPGHIALSKGYSKGIENERKNYFKRLEKTNQWLKSIISTITELDENSLIVLVSDHGSYVGYGYTEECYIKNTDESLIQSTFSTLLAIKWPNNKVPEYDYNLKTNVNLFRILFSYLSEDTSYLEHLQDDKSYMIINKGSPYGVYELINENGEFVFNKHIEL